MENTHYLDFNKKTARKVMNQLDNYMKVNGDYYTLDGENISEQYVGEELRPLYISEKQQKEYKSKQILGEHEKEHGGFIFMFYKTLQNFNELIPDLTKADISRLLFLSTYVSYDENKIQYDNGLELSDKGLIELLRLNRNSYKKFMGKLIDNRILYTDENNNKFLSDSFCKYGSIDVKRLKQNEIGYIRLFKGTVRDLFDITPLRELGRLSTIYMILPYLNLATNIVSHNPEELDVDKVIPMTIMELTELLEYSNHTKFRQSLYNIKIKDETAFGFVMTEDDKRSMKMIVNPRVVFAGNAEQLKTIQALFRKSK